jgi:hypothetical protein
MAALHGALSCIAETWVQDIPPVPRDRARFGNPAFRTWHQRLESNSTAIVKAIMTSHVTYLAGIQEDSRPTGDKGRTYQINFEYRILEHCAHLGYHAAAEPAERQDPVVSHTTPTQEEIFLRELRTHLHLSFGHPIRLDFGTGHESCFFIFLFCLFKLGIFGFMNPSSQGLTPSPDIMAPVALSIVTQYLKVCRRLQVDYLLEPAGSHGVWGLDDYHCVPFFIGACQLQQPSKYSLESIKHLGEIKPSSIHKDDVLHSDASDVFMYLGCIRYIKSIKKGVPFFESSPMLNDISQLPDWIKVSSGLLRLYEGEVLDKFEVVQHFVFGELFKGEFLIVVTHFIHVYLQHTCQSTFSATWVPSEKPQVAPTQTFVHHAQVDDCIAPWARNK